MAGQLVRIITSTDPAVRDTALEAVCRRASYAELLAECAELEAFRHTSNNLYERVRACFFLYAIYRFHLPLKPELPALGLVPFQGYTFLLRRRFEEAIDVFRATEQHQGLISSDWPLVLIQLGPLPT